MCGEIARDVTLARAAVGTVGSGFDANGLSEGASVGFQCTSDADEHEVLIDPHDAVPAMHRHGRRIKAHLLDRYDISPRGRRLGAGHGHDCTDG